MSKSPVPAAEVDSNIVAQQSPELEGLRKENQSLRTRLLGVNELARLLQEKTEAYDNLRDRTKRQEIAIIRLENRCSNYDKKLRQALAAGDNGTTGGSGPALKSNQSPFIPGPSRQIMEGLMKENSGLKKAINNVIKKSESGYLEAVKITQLEEEIDLKAQEVEFMKGQIETLTAHSGEESWVTNPGALQRQLIKQQQSMKAKDRFCTLLSDQVQQLQKQLESKGTDGTDSGFASQEGVSQKLDSLQRQLEQEQKEKNEQTDNLNSKISSLEREIDQLKSRVDDLNSYNDTLLEEKGQLNAKISELKKHESSLASMEQSIQAAQMRHSADLDAKQKEIRGLQADVDKANLQIATFNSMHPRQTPSNDKYIRDLMQQLKNVSDERDGWQTRADRFSRQVMELKQRQQQVYYSHQHPIQTIPLSTGGVHSQILTNQHMHGGIAVRDSPREIRPHPLTEPHPSRSVNCGPNITETTIRTPLLVRDTGPDPDVIPVTTSAHHVPPGSLSLNTQASSSRSYSTNAGPSTISSPNRIASTPHSSSAQTPGYAPTPGYAQTPGYARPPMHPSRMNSSESGYYGSGLSHSSMGSSLGSSYPSSSGPPSGYPSSSLPHNYPHSNLQQHYDSGLQGQPLPRGQQPPQGPGRYYDSHYPNRRPGNQ